MVVCSIEENNSKYTEVMLQEERIEVGYQKGRQ
jgi:hypothetical protein